MVHDDSSPFSIFKNREKSSGQQCLEIPITSPQNLVLAKSRAHKLTASNSLNDLANFTAA